MDPRTELDVSPTFGHGWIIMGRPRFAIPEPFKISIESSELRGPRHWEGIVTTEGHEFFGARVALQQRHTTWTGAVNVTVSRDGQGALAQGFANVASE